MGKEAGVGQPLFKDSLAACVNDEVKAFHP